MEYFQAQTLECVIGIMTAVILAGIIMICIWQRRIFKITIETEENLLRRIDDLAASISVDKMRMERDLKESYDATNRVVAELVRSQQTRLDAFSGQMASWQPSVSAPVEPDIRVEELIEEIRRTSEAVFNLKSSMQTFVTREELGAYFTGLSDEVRKIAEEIRTLPVMEGQDACDTQLLQIFERAQNEIALFNAALDSTKKRLKQTNESMEDAARCSKKFQKKIKRAVGGEE